MRIPHNNNALLHNTMRPSPGLIIEVLIGTAGGPAAWAVQGLNRDK